MPDSRVIVVGSTTTALSCLRLARQATPEVYGACAPGSWPTRTRFFRPPPAGPEGRWIGQLGSEGYRWLEALPLERCVLIPTADDAALWVSDLPGPLRERFPVSSSSRQALERLQDKAEFAALADELLVPAPFSKRIRSEEDIAGLPFEELDALFLKPRDSQAFVQAYNRKAIRVWSREEAASAWGEVHADGHEMIAQEYVRGGADDHYFIDGFRDGRGRVTAKTARRRIRIYPRDFGNSSYCESIAFEQVDAAWDGLERMLSAVSYRGVFSAEFKQDAGSGVFKILEINTRPWVYVEFAGACGMNMCELAIEDALTGGSRTVSDYRSGLGCVDLYNDMISVIETPSAERPPWPGLLVCWLRSFKMLFSWRDPWPGILFSVRKISHLISTRLSRFLSGRPTG